MIVENSHKIFCEDPCTHARARGKNVRVWAILAKWGKTGPKGGQMGPQGADFLHAGIFLWDENIMFSKPGTQTKIGRAMGILLIPRFWSDSTKNGVPFLVLPWRGHQIILGRGSKKLHINKLSDDIKKISSDKYKKSDPAFSGAWSKSRNQQNPHSSAYFCFSVWLAKHIIFIS